MFSGHSVLSDEAPDGSTRFRSYSVHVKRFFFRVNNALRHNAIDQIFLSSLRYQTRFKYSNEIPKYLTLSSNYYVPDIHIEVNFLSPFTADVQMHYKNNKVKNIRYFYYVDFRLFLDAKILEVKETGFLRSSNSKTKESQKEAANKYNKSESIQDKLTKSLVVKEWLNELIKLKYTLDTTK